ncbi:MAG: hypothetical protein L0Y80_12975 [Ignavibacteriae bacterium]|nr:hypothetical protein [Ignavibacteriota bacterium]
MNFTKYMLTLTALLCLIASLTAGQNKDHETGFLVLAPDRGFLGNEEIREAFEEYRTGFNTALVVVTREETARFLKEGISFLEQKGAKKIVAIPMFLSEHQSSYQYAERFLTGSEAAKLTALPVVLAETMSHSYLTSEVLADRIGALSANPALEALVLIAQGVANPDDATKLADDLRQLRTRLSSRYSFGGYAEVALLDGSQSPSSQSGWTQFEEVLKNAQAKNLKPLVVPLDLSWKADGMMSLAFRLQRVVRQYNALYDGADLTPHPNLALWLKKQSNSQLPITAENLGIIFMPHGSNYNWNRTMMDAVEPLLSKYKIEHAFSMGDADIIERAVRKLEQRGARAISVVRVFSMESSFKDVTEQALGLNDGAHAGYEGMSSTPIRSGCAFYTLGGVEASPLFAEALLDRALEVSKDPKKETIILLAHGTESEEANRRWENNLSALTSHMSLVAKLKGKPFKQILSATWREDWPELREKAIENIRSMVKTASEDGGTAIVIPARTTRGGREEEWLKGLKYVYNGNGFAPHKLFVRWVEEQILLSLAHFNNAEPPAGIVSTPANATQHKHTGKQ